MSNRIVMPVVKVVCDDFAVEDEAGELFYPRADEWVKLKKRIPGRLLKLLLKLMRLQSEMDEEETAGEFEGVLDQLAPLMAGSIVAWNWHDLWAEGDELPVLPKPTADVILDLDISEIFYLAGKLFELTQSPKANASQ